MGCPKCGSETCTKDGLAKGKQRYKCKFCGFRHTVKSRGISLAVKQQALQLYQDGLDFRSISKTLKCSHVSVYNWIKWYKQSLGQNNIEEVSPSDKEKR